MHISEAQRYELIDRVTHEGEPELLFAPLQSPPPGLPAGWGEILTAREPQTATLRLWNRVIHRLPRITQALRQRLQGIAHLRTEDVPESLIYFFKDGLEMFAYRGFPPAAELPTAPGIPEVRDFYSLHDGWISAYTRDDGPMPTSQWRLLSESLWPETQWKFPPGVTRLEDLAAVYVDEDQLAFAVDAARPGRLPLVCWQDGEIEAVADLWDAIDREVGTFLLELDPATQEQPPADAGRQQYLDRTLEGIAARWPEAARLGGGYYQRQWCLMLIDRAGLQSALPREELSASGHLREALDHYCRSLELGAGSTPLEILEFFGLAHVMGDAASARFLASAPPDLWADETVETVQTRLTFCLHKRNYEIAGGLVDEAAGLLEQASDNAIALRSMQRCLDDLFRRDQTAFRRSRASLEEVLIALPRPPWMALFPAFRVAALDAVASSLA